MSDDVGGKYALSAGSLPATGYVLYIAGDGYSDDYSTCRPAWGDDQMRAYAAEAVATERARWEAAASAAVQELAGCATWTAGGIACQALRDILRA